MADVAPVFTSVASGRHGCILDVWLPITQKIYRRIWRDMVDLGFHTKTPVLHLLYHLMWKSKA